MVTVPVWKALTIHGCAKIDYTKKAVRDSFLTYDFQLDQVFGFAEDSAQAEKYIRGGYSTPSSVIRLAVSVDSFVAVSRDIFESIRCNYNEYEGYWIILAEARDRESTNAVKLDGIFK